VISLTHPTTGGGSGTAGIKEYFTADPIAPVAETAWVLRTGSGGGIVQLSTKGVPIGLLLSLTYAVTASTTGIAYTYQFSYRTKEGTTIRSALT
jgi:hypothetical protein